MQNFADCVHHHENAIENVIFFLAICRGFDIRFAGIRESGRLMVQILWPKNNWQKFTESERYSVVNSEFCASTLSLLKMSIFNKFLDEVMNVATTLTEPP